MSVILVFVLPRICFTQIFLTGRIPWKVGLSGKLHTAVWTQTVAQVSLCQLWRCQQCQFSQVLKRETLNSSNSLISKASCPTTLIKHWSKSLATLPPAARSSSSKMEKIVSMKPCTVTMVLKSKFKRDHSPATKFHGRWWGPSQNQKAKDVEWCCVLLELV